MSRSTAAGIAFLFTLLMACGGEPEVDPQPPRAVRSELVSLGGAERVRTFAGVTRAGRESNLSFKVSGTAVDVSVKLGDRVRAGQELARLDARDYQIEVGNSEAALRQVQATAAGARSSYMRTEGLYENNNASLADLEAARAQHDAAEASVRSAENALELAQTRLSYTTLVAPSDGAIARADIEVGENVQVGQTVIVLSAGQRGEVEIVVPEAFIGQIREGDTAEVQVDAVAGEDIDATVIEVGVTTTSSGTGYPLKLRFDTVQSAIRPGMACEVRLHLEARGGADRILVPPAAIAEDGRGRFAFVVREIADEQGVATRVEVTTGDLTSLGLEVLSGLEDGDRVVTAGVGRLVDGETVRLWHDPNAQP